MRAKIQTFCGIAVFLALFFSWLWVFTFANRIRIYNDRARYRPETFIVSGAIYANGEDGPDYWLVGLVAGRQERFVPRLRGKSVPRSADDLDRRYPRGTQLPVLYNPGATFTLTQGESLRVLEAGPDFWDREARLRRKLGLYVFVPVPVTLAVYLVVRYANRRRTRLRAVSRAT